MLDKTGNRKSGEYGRYSFYADRYDYLRIANMIMNHWNNDTCVGKYLKTMYENRVDRKLWMSIVIRGNHSASTNLWWSVSMGCYWFRRQTYFNDGWCSWSTSSY